MITHTDNKYPPSEKRLMAELKMMKDPQNPKRVMEHPIDHFDSEEAAQELADCCCCKLHKSDSNYYFSNEDVDDDELEDAVANGKHGGLMGYGEESATGEGITVGLTLDGTILTEPEAIIEARDSDTLAFALEAKDIPTAIALILPHIKTLTT